MALFSPSPLPLHGSSLSSMMSSDAGRPSRDRDRLHNLYFDLQHDPFTTVHTRATTLLGEGPTTIIIMADWLFAHSLARSHPSLPLVLGTNDLHHRNTRALNSLITHLTRAHNLASAYPHTGSSIICNLNVQVIRAAIEAATQGNKGVKIASARMKMVTRDAHSDNVQAQVRK